MSEFFIIGNHLDRSKLEFCPFLMIHADLGVVDSKRAAVPLTDDPNNAPVDADTLYRMICLPIISPIS